MKQVGTRDTGAYVVCTHRHDTKLHLGPGAVQVIRRPYWCDEVQPPLHRDARNVADALNALPWRRGQMRVR